MTRALRYETPDAFFHITSRGTAKRAIFISRYDHQMFCELLGLVVARFAWICHSFCLVQNHFHLLVETPNTNLASGMKYLNGVYSQRFNRIHGRIGHLMQDRYYSRIIETDPDCLAVARYVALNPVNAGLCGHPLDWEWGSYRTILGFPSAFDFIDCRLLLSMFTDDTKAARLSFMKFVEEDAAENANYEIGQGVVAGSTSDAKRPRKSLHDLIIDVCDTCVRDQSMLLAHTKHGYTIEEIASQTGFHPASVSRMINRARKRAGV